MRKEVTIKDVAKAAGVSSMTVSRVLNDRPDVSPQTRKRVQEIISELGYAPSLIARNLSQGRSSTLGVVSSSLEFYGPSRTLVGIEQKASELGFSLMISLLHDPLVNRGEQALDDLLAYQVAGIIWAVAEIGDHQEWLVGRLKEIATPVVLISMEPRPETSLVTVNNRQGGRAAAEHLLAQGYRKVGIISGPESWWEARQRELGWREVMEAAGHKELDMLRETGNWTAASGNVAMKALLERVPDLDAVFVCNDSMALGAYQAAKRYGRSLPQDLGIVGFDDIPEAAYFSPPLTTIRQDLLELGCQAVGLLNRQLEADRNEEVLAAQVSWLQPDLVVRSSTGH
jgi:LacI family transcriptional regulator